MGLSIIISYHNESQPFLEECLKQVRDTVRVFPYELIVVDDYSDVPLELDDDITVVRHDNNKGIGQVFDTGVSHARYSNLFLMACDMRFIDNGWSEKLFAEIQEYPRSLICTSCVVLNANSPQNMDITYRRTKSIVGGATILIFHDHKSNPKKAKNFRGLIEAKWLPHKSGESHEVPCILGACYGCTKQWYEYIDGFWGHRHWGGLEPYISMKSYLFGGSCRIVPEAETGHVFKKDGTHDTPQESVIYNKLLISKLLFDDSERLINFLGNNPTVRAAKNRISLNITDIEKKREEYKLETVFPMCEYIKKFGLDYRKDQYNLLFSELCSTLQRK